MVTGCPAGTFVVFRWCGKRPGGTAGGFFRFAAHNCFLRSAAIRGTILVDFPTTVTILTALGLRDYAQNNDVLWC